MPSPNGASTDSDARATALEWLRALDEHLARTDIEVEFYFLSGRVLLQVFSANPETARHDALLRSSQELRGVLGEVGESDARTGASDGAKADAPYETGWLAEAVKAVVDGPGDPYVALERVRAFRPIPAYVLALKCATRLQADDAPVRDEIRALLRLMEITSVDEAAKAIRPYFADRQLPDDTTELLERLLA